MKEPRWPLGSGVERDVEDEIAGHIELRARDLEREGIPPDEARRQARAAFGARARIGSECVAIQRDMERRRRMRMRVEELARDVAWAMRSLSRAPGFTAFAALTLALGIAANTSIFSVVNGLFLRPLPGVRDPGTLVELSRGPGFISVSYPMFEHWRDNAPLLDDLAAFDLVGLAVGGDESPEVVLGLQVSGNYFEVLGTRPALGRFFAPDEGWHPRSRPVVVISHAFWTRRFEADPSVVGRAVLLNGVPTTVIGITEEGFGGPMAAVQAAAWVPLGAPIPSVHQGQLDFVDSGVLELVGRAQPGTDLELLSEQLSRLATARLRADDPTAKEYVGQARAYGPIPSTVRGPASAFFGVLGVLVALLLVISCVNVANLLISRSATRRHEIAIRLSLGAGRGRLLQQLVTESVVLATLAGALGVLVTFWATAALSAFQLPLSPLPGLRLDLHLTPDARVLTFSVALAALTGIVFGIVPALRATRPDLVSDLGSAASKGGRTRLQGVLVGAQVAGTIVLLTGSGLFLRAVMTVQSLDPGFDTGDVYVANFDLELAGRSPAEAWPFYEELGRRASRLPGVLEASWAGKAPIAGLSQMSPVNFEGVVPPEGRQGFTLANQSVGPGYFETLRIPLLRGRGFTERDTPDASRVVVVNEHLADRMWPGESALGRHVSMPSFTGETLRAEVVGVVGTAKYTSLSEEPRMFAYFPATQRPRTDLILHLLMAPGVPPPFAEVRTAASAIEPAAAVLSAGSLEAVVGVYMIPQRIGAWVTGLVGAFGLLLGAVGVYAITAYWVARRTREVGLRMALGAGKGAVVYEIVTRGMRAPLVGAVVGLALAVAGTRFLEAFIFGVSPLDPVTFLSVLGVLGLTAFLANLVPALRATRVNPVVALGAD